MKINKTSGLYLEIKFCKIFKVCFRTFSKNVYKWTITIIRKCLDKRLLTDNLRIVRFQIWQVAHLLSLLCPRSPFRLKSVFKFKMKKNFKTFSEKFKSPTVPSLMFPAGSERGKVKQKVFFEGREREGAKGRVKISVVARNVHQNYFLALF